MQVINDALRRGIDWQFIATRHDIETSFGSAKIVDRHVDDVIRQAPVSPTAFGEDMLVIANNFHIGNVESTRCLS